MDAAIETAINTAIVNHITTTVSKAIVHVVQKRQVLLRILIIRCVFFFSKGEKAPQGLHPRHLGISFIRALQEGPDTMWLRIFRFTQGSFIGMMHWLQVNAPFRPSPSVTDYEKLAIFLYIMYQGVPQGVAAYWFGRSDETINRVFHEVLDSMIILARTVINLTPQPLPPYLRENPKFYPFFQDCIGAVDGSHYPCRPPKDLAEVFRNRKGVTSLNVMVIVDFDGRFRYVLPGWEGSAHDSKVYMDAVHRKLTIDEGKYVIADAGYPCAYRLMSPKRGVRYHLQETARRNKRPRDPDELFNLRHSQLRIKVEMVLGWHKAKFRILTSRPYYPIKTQCKFIYASCGIMNWILDYKNVTDLGEDGAWYPDLGAPQTIPRERPGMDLSLWERDSSDMGYMSIYRDDIAEAMWEQYQGYLRDREGGERHINDGDE